jgi:hypothetical protein
VRGRERGKGWGESELDRGGDRERESAKER